MSELHDLQVLHVRCVAKLLGYAETLGYSITWGETIRSKAQATANAQAGVGIVASLHELGLAIDLNLFRGNLYLTRSEDHAILGTFWKSMHPLCRWGGDFKDSNGNPKPDGNHYSIEYRGVK